MGADCAAPPVMRLAGRFAVPAHPLPRGSVGRNPHRTALNERRSPIGESPARSTLFIKDCAMHSMVYRPSVNNTFTYKNRIFVTSRFFTACIAAAIGCVALPDAPSRSGCRNRIRGSSGCSIRSSATATWANRSGWSVRPVTRRSAAGRTGRTGWMCWMCWMWSAHTCRPLDRDRRERRRQRHA